MSKKGFGPGVWCVFGDFNCVLQDSERRGMNLHNSQSQREQIREFQNFIQYMQLFDLPLLGRKFTWEQPNGAASSRLDRFLLNDMWSNYWPNVSQWAMKRDVSDHCPVVLRYADIGWGPKPFRFNNHWLKHKDIDEVVKQSWNSGHQRGLMAFILKDKLKKLKSDLKSWNVVVFGDRESKIQSLIETIQQMDVKSEGPGLSLSEVADRKNMFQDLWTLLKSKDSIAFQRARSRWLKEGDANTSFFHSCIKLRSSANRILALKVQDKWIEDAKGVREEVFLFFKKHFSETSLDRPVMDGVEFPCLSREMAVSLSAPFTLEEIESVVASIDGNKLMNLQIKCAYSVRHHY